MGTTARPPCLAGFILQLARFLSCPRPSACSSLSASTLGLRVHRLCAKPDSSMAAPAARCSRASLLAAVFAAVLLVLVAGTHVDAAGTTTTAAAKSATTAAAATSSKSITATLCTKGVRTRKELRDLTTAELDAVKKAFVMLYKTGRIAHYVNMHRDNSAVAHNSPHFLIWHRAMLAMFEAEFLAAAENKVAGLPYWASTLDAAEPSKSQVFTSKYFGSSSGCLDGAFAGFVHDDDGKCVSRALQQGAWVVEPVQAILTRASRNSYSAFSTYVEYGSHAAVHNGVGGDMANLLKSPWDPLFWMHHAGVDWFWSKWQAQSAANAAMYDGKHNNQPVSKTEDVNGFVANDLLDYQKTLCYVYADPGAGTPSTNTTTSTSSTASSSSTTSVPATKTSIDTKSTSTTSTSTSTPAPTSRPSPPDWLHGLTRIPDLGAFSDDFLASFQFPRARLDAVMSHVRVAQRWAGKRLVDGQSLPSLNDVQNIDLGAVEKLLTDAAASLADDAPKTVSADAAGAAEETNTPGKSGAVAQAVGSGVAVLAAVAAVAAVVV
ncbi:hypothetical protein AMAG_16322 [Allomyces macrogynus ATCC 38327]|uniref:Tyrosinase copper-binding domain-containing protein n=1 Tax=Allomyces macrogynus (strain ATCC 38327) TaxID=578462 RepID=A0A0L0TBD6_ALLM3|nr:hypothetical protein AMAG_16322 [Allomyces macrogynus ATCC 38327]|eukprot:KNE71894.1 hypothetical protein AMAG_16322 [Allomyces macrogynus ATCC 38327]